jgi:superfamily II DNA or RNA helicase
MVTLLPCQKKAADEFVKKCGRIYLVSPVGHGKTLCAAECFRRSMEKYPAPALYLTTKTARAEQVKKFRDYGLDVIVVDKYGDKRSELWTDIKQSSIYVATLEVIGTDDWKLIRNVPWGMVGIDEADRLTAGASKRNRRLLSLIGVRHRLMMTGTELRNGLRDSFFPVMWLSKIPPWKHWTDFSNSELLHDNPNQPHQITGIRDENRLASLISPFMTEMVNSDAPKELMPTIIDVQLNEGQREAYETLKRDLMLKAENGTLVISNHGVLNLRLRQLVVMPEALGLGVPSAKESALLELLPKLEGKTIVFSSFATAASILAKRHGWPVIQGSTPTKERKRITDSQPNILVATSAAERGIDLGWLTNVISLDRGFTSATLRQRAGRATRYGRKGQAKLYLFRSPDTVDIESEEKIVRKKLNQARKIWLKKQEPSRR